MNLTHLRKRMKSGEKAIGPIMTYPCWQTVHTAAGFTAYNYLWIDMEHGPFTLETTAGMVATCQGQSAVIVRPPAGQHWMIKNVLDTGAEGVVIPMVNTRKEAEEIVSALLYPPDGIRGFGPDFASRVWGVSITDYPHLANEELLLVIQIESREGLKNAKEIAQVPRVDLLFAGAYDLSVSLEKPGKVEDPEVDAAILSVLDAAHAHGKLAGTIVADPDQGRKRLEQGFDLLVTGTDSMLFQQGISAFIKGLGL